MSSECLRNSKEAGEEGGNRQTVETARGQITQGTVGHGKECG